MKYEEFYDLNAARPMIEKRFTKNPRSSISAMYRDLRKNPYFRYFGDYPIMAVVLNTVRKLGIGVTRTALNYACRQSTELSPKGIKRMLLKG